VCDLATGLVRQVIARGTAEILPFDVPRGRPKLTRYLGADEPAWDGRFRRYLHDDPADRSGVAPAPAILPDRQRPQLHRLNRTPAALRAGG
jgi:hypothetical protein